VLPLLNSSDQARRVGKDGRVNLSLATAYEIGRLLALADPSVVAALLTWRKDGLDLARRNSLIATEPSLSALGVADLAVGFAARAGGTLVTSLGANGAVRLGTARPPTDPGRPVPGLPAGAAAVQQVALGFAVPAAQIQQLITPGVQRAPLTVPIAPQNAQLDKLAAAAPVELAALRTASYGAAAAMTADLLGTLTNGQGGGKGNSAGTAPHDDTGKEG
jgi:hypothetical protein